MLSVWRAAAPSPLVRVSWAAADQKGVVLYCKRDDLLDPAISGNKWRKLLPQAAWYVRAGIRTFHSVGGRHSNHLAALAALGARFGLPTVGYVRGGVPQELTPTLAQARAYGMELRPLSRTEVRRLRSGALQPDVPDRSIFIPEGGTSRLGLLGPADCARETESQLGHAPTTYVLAAGSGGTAVGLARATTASVLAVSAVRDDDLLPRMNRLTEQQIKKTNLRLLSPWRATKFASGEQDIFDCIRHFRQFNGITLDPIYGAKALLRLNELLEAGHFSRGSSVVLVHTGGLQGLPAWCSRYGYELSDLVSAVASSTASDVS